MAETNRRRKQRPWRTIRSTDANLGPFQTSGFVDPTLRMEIWIRVENSMNMRLALLATVVCFHICAVRCQDPKDEVEIMPEALEKERKRMKLFWAIMYEVCRTFCVWKSFCQSFCQKLNPDQSPEFDMTFDLMLASEPLTAVSEMAGEKTMWLYSTVSDICDDDSACIESCLDMEPDEDEPWQDEPPANILRALYELAKTYFLQCATMNEKPLTVVDAFTVKQFCREITAASREFTQHCVASLTG